VPADHKVSVAWQIVATFIPIANFWAFYRIRKLRKYLAYVFVPSLVFSVATTVYYFSTTNDRFESSTNALSDPVAEVVGGVINSAFVGLTIYLVIKWSRDYNREFEQSMEYARKQIAAPIKPKPINIMS
jgi:hypothetical protein